MGFHFSTSLQHLFERMSEPLHDFFHSAVPAAADATRKHELLWTCYASGQMSDADLEREIAADPALADFVRRRERERH